MAARNGCICGKDSCRELQNQLSKAEDSRGGFIHLEAHQGDGDKKKAFRLMLKAQLKCLNANCDHLVCNSEVLKAQPRVRIAKLHYTAEQLALFSGPGKSAAILVDRDTAREATQYFDPDKKNSFRGKYFITPNVPLSEVALHAESVLSNRGDRTSSRTARIQEAQLILHLFKMSYHMQTLDTSRI